MARRVLPFTLAAAILAVMTGCSLYERPERPAWRGQAEAICLQEKRVQASAYAMPTKSIEGPGICGLDNPFKVTALAQGTVSLNNGTLGCPMIAALDAWIVDVVQPTAMARFGQPVTAISSMGSYGCRGINNKRGARLSEHAFGNAVDIGGFELADGRKMRVETGWKSSDPQEQAFLKEVHAGSCRFFTTVLGPGSDMFHYNHFHLDLAQHGNTSRGPRRICKPAPAPGLLPMPPQSDGLPDPPDIEEDMEIARARVPTGPRSYGRSSIAIAAPVQRAPLYRPDAAAVPVPASPLPPAYVARPVQLGQPAPLPRHDDPDPIGGMIREDGAFVPQDYDPGTTSSIRRR